MMESKKSFVLYVDTLEILEDLNIEQRGELFYAIYQYQSGQDYTVKGEVKIVFKMLLKQFIRDSSKWEDIKKKRSDAGKKGAEAKQKLANQANASFDKQDSANQAVTVNGTVTVTETVNGSGNVIQSPIPFFKSYMDVKEFLEERGEANCSISVKLGDIIVKVSKHGKAYDAETIKDLDFKTETIFLKYLMNNTEEI